MKSSINVSKENNKENESAKPNPILENLKSDFFWKNYMILCQKRKNLKLLNIIKRYKKD